MHPFKNLLQKVRALLKEDDHLTKEQCEQHQWQLLVKLPNDYTFIVGKGGVNTIFYSETSTERAVCYPDEIIALLERLSRENRFGYLALNAKRNPLCYSYNLEAMKAVKDCRYIAEINLKGKKRVCMEKTKDLYGKFDWQER